MERTRWTTWTLLAAVVATAATAAALAPPCIYLLGTRICGG